MTAPKKRRMWDDVLPGWRHAHQTARDHDTSHHTRAVLEAALYLLAAHQRTEDRIRLSQVAHEAGIWDGNGTCPRSSSAAAGRQLAELDRIGALHYEADRSRRGCLIRLLTPAEVDAHRATQARDTDQPDARPGRATDGPRRATSPRDDTEPVARPGPTLSRDLDAPVARSSRPRRATRSRASEGFPEGLPEGKNPRGTDDGPTGTASGGPSTDADERCDEEDDVDHLSRTLANLVPPNEPPMGPHSDDAWAIDTWIDTHAPDLRDLIAVRITADQLAPGQVRLAARTARTVATDAGRDLPRLALPPRRSTP